MFKSRQGFIQLAIIVIVWYLGLSYLPQIVGTCFGGNCGFTVGELIVSFAVPLAFIAMPIVLDLVLNKQGLAQALSEIGLTRFNWTGIRLAIVYLLPLLVFYPLFALLTNSPLTIQTAWPWLLINAVLINGLAEETMMRGFVFRHLREGRTFWRAAALATVFFALYHFPLILSAGLVVGIIAVVIAIPTGFLTAYIYERGNNTIWGSALLHAVYNALAYVFVFPADKQPIASSLYLVAGIIISTIMLARAYRSGYGRMDAQATRQPSVSSV
jgi:membrane protease YdiL (CAAX protease family)